MKGDTLPERKSLDLLGRVERKRVRMSRKTEVLQAEHKRGSGASIS